MRTVDTQLDFLPTIQSSMVKKYPHNYNQLSTPGVEVVLEEGKTIIFLFLSQRLTVYISLK